MLEEFLPAESFLGIGFEHASDEVFAHIGDVVDGSWEIEVFLSDHGFEFVDVLGVVGRTG